MSERERKRVCASVCICESTHLIGGERVVLLQHCLGNHVREVPGIGLRVWGGGFRVQGSWVWSLIFGFGV